MDSRESGNWGNSTWVLSLMHFPHEAALLEHVASGNETMLMHADGWRKSRETAARAGIVAGNVLMVLYTLSASPWRIAEPSLAKAFHIAEQFGYETRYADGSPMPRGKTEIRACFDAMRPAAHLWAALRLHRAYPTMAHEELISTDRGFSTLLSLARGVQDWALAWKPARTRNAPPLLGATPWLVPESIVPMPVPWTDKPDWLLGQLNTYRRQTR